MNCDLLMLSTAIAAVSCCVWKNFFQDKNNLDTDHLTGMKNRHFLQKIEEKEMSGNKYYVVFADIDFFKNINDTYGHDAGDIALKEFSRILRQSIKSGSDYIIRWGGEEFVLFLKVNDPNIFNKEILYDRINNLRKTIERSLISINSNNQIKFTSSFGVSIDLDKNIEDRIKIADKNLYEAKESGRNKVVI